MLVNFSINESFVRGDVTEFGYVDINLDSYNNETSNKSSDCFEIYSLGYESTHQIVIAFFLTIIVILTIMGNILVLLAIFKFNYMRTKTNNFVFSLAIADLLVGIIVMPISIMNQVQNGMWEFDALFCKLFNCFDVYGTTASIVHLSCIAMDRYWAITDPFHYTTRMNKKLQIILLLSCWTIPAGISFFPIMLDWHQTGEQVDLDCSVCVFRVNKYFAVICSSIAFYIPVILMIICYTRIFVIAQRQERQIADLEMSVSAITETHHSNNRTTGGSNSAGRRFRREFKAAKTLSIIMGAFSICWFPFFILNVIDPFYTLDLTKGSKITHTVTWLGYCNSTLNPVLYYVSNKTFKKAFRSLCICTHCTNEVETTDTGLSSSRES